MATSPIYSWPEPDNTDLVKNGALAIRTLGNAIDTTMGTMVPKTIIDAKGDLIAGTAADTAARVPVGTNGQVLVADSTAAAGVAWSSAAASSPLTTKGDLYGFSTVNARVPVGTNGQVLTADSTAATGVAWTAAGAPTYTWATYTPSNTGITLGNGTETARYVKVGKTVFVSYKLVLGSTSSFSGAIYVGLPSVNNSISTCSINATDAGAGNYLASGVADASTGTVLCRPIKTNATYATWDDNLSSMFTWGNTDVLQFFITYEEA
jgi:hypothetical protein